MFKLESARYIRYASRPGQLASGLTSAHVAAALRTTTAYKTQLVRRVARQVVDLAAGRRTIEAELSEWERMLARTDLDAASK